MKKIVRLTENDLIKIVKRAIKENEDFRSDMGVSPVFEDIMNEIEKMYEDITYAESIKELEMIDRDLQYLYREIEMSEDLSDDEKDELIDNLDGCSQIADDMYSKFSEEEDDDDMPSYKTKWRMPSDDDM
jgi:ArsR family metal-binding transcriptional regulator